MQQRMKNGPGLLRPSTATRATTGSSRAPRGTRGRGGCRSGSAASRARRCGSSSGPRCTAPCSGATACTPGRSQRSRAFRTRSARLLTGCSCRKGSCLFRRHSARSWRTSPSCTLPRCPRRCCRPRPRSGLTGSHRAARHCYQRQGGRPCSAPLWRPARRRCTPRTRTG